MRHICAKCWYRTSKMERKPTGRHLFSCRSHRSGVSRKPIAPSRTSRAFHSCRACHWVSQLPGPAPDPYSDKTGTAVGLTVPPHSELGPAFSEIHHPESHPQSRHLTPSPSAPSTTRPESGVTHPVPCYSLKLTSLIPFPGRCFQSAHRTFRQRQYS